VVNEKNECPISDPSRIMASMSNELNGVHKETLKEYVKKDILDILKEDLQEKLEKNIQNQMKEYQDNTNKKLEKTQE
jgi:hypothetical protein